MKSLRLAAVLLLFTSTTFAAEPPAAPKKPRAVVRSGGQWGWVIRKDRPGLREILGETYLNAVKKVNPTAARLAQYNKRIKQIKDPTGSEEDQRFERTLVLFRQYGFDPLMLAAQGYQESRLTSTPGRSTWISS